MFERRVERDMLTYAIPHNVGCKRAAGQESGATAPGELAVVGRTADDFISMDPDGWKLAAQY